MHILIFFFVWPTEAPHCCHVMKRDRIANLLLLVLCRRMNRLITGIMKRKRDGFISCIFFKWRYHVKEFRKRVTFHSRVLNGNDCPFSFTTKKKKRFGGGLAASALSISFFFKDDAMNFSATIHHIDVENFIFSETWWENFCLSYFSLNILNSRMPFLGSTWPLLLIWKPAHHFFRRSFTLLSADRSVKFEGLKGFREEREKTWFSFSQKKCWKCWNQFWAAGNSREIQAGFFLCIFFFFRKIHSQISRIRF